MKNLFKRPADFIIGGKDNPYLYRWWLIPRNRFFNVYLHKIVRDDDDRALHDHPWWNCSIVLKGGYYEHTPKGVFWRKPRSITFRRATASHRLELDKVRGFIMSDGECTDLPTIVHPAWTLFITGPRIREWGFHCPKGWRHWKEFTSAADPGAVGKGCDD